jgi:hypothetical protein
MNKPVRLIPKTKPAPALPKKQIPDPQLSDVEKAQFFNALASGDPAMVKSYLQKHPGLANVRMSYFQPKTGSQTPLIFTVTEPRFYDLGILKMFLDAGANINEQDDYGDNPLSYALRTNGSFGAFGHQLLFNFLIDNGADLNARNNEGKTPLIIAAELGLSEVVEHMISSRNLDITQITAEQNKSSYFKLLPTDLRKMVSTKSLNPNIKDNQGKTALDYAIAREKVAPRNLSISSRYRKIIKLLKSITAE